MLNWELIYMKEYMKHIKEDTFKNAQNKENYMRMKTMRARGDRFVRETSSEIQKLIPRAILNDVGRARGRAGYNWLSMYLKIPTVSAPIKFNDKAYNITQYCNKFYVGEIIKATCIDKNGAYAWWLQHKIPHEELEEYEEGCAILYISKKTKKAQWMPPKNEQLFEKKYYALRQIQGVEQFSKVYKTCLGLDKQLTKSLVVSGVGYLTKKNYIVAQYIWYKQGEEILKIKEDITLQGGIVLKIHTDSITWVHDDKIKVNQESYKFEKINTNIYIVNAGMYQWEGDYPKGINPPKDPLVIEYEDGVKLNINNFPCLRHKHKYLAWYNKQLTYCSQGNVMGLE